VVNLSVWREDICVGTVRLRPAEAAALVEGLTQGLVELAERPADDATRMREMEARLARLEGRLAEPVWRTAAARAARSVRGTLTAVRPGAQP